MTRGDLREVRRDDRRSERRAQLLGDSIEAIRELGAGATMDQLARRGGVTKPILYRHFRDRDGLIIAIVEHFAEALQGAIDESLRTTKSAKDLLESTLDAYLAFLEKETELYRFLVHHTVSPAPGMIPTSALADGIARRVAGLIGAQLKFAGMDTAAAAPWAHALVGMVHQAGDWWLEDGTMPRADLSRYLSTLIWEGVSSVTAVGIHPPSAT